MQPDQQRIYLSEFGEILIYLLTGIVFIMITLLVSRLIRPNRPNPEKLTTYESGEEPVSSPWTQFNIRFYVVALIFLLFEVEIVFLFPWATVFAKKELIDQTNGVWGWFAMLEMLVFILILAVGLAYAWVNGFLDWVKPNPAPTEINSPVPKELYQQLNRKYSGNQKGDHSSEKLTK
jgi:NADH-quinone oxidoreductase subunit A